MNVSPFAGRCLTVTASLFDRGDPHLINDYRGDPRKVELGLTTEELAMLANRLRGSAAGWLARQGWTRRLSLVGAPRRASAWASDAVELHFGPATFQMIRWLAAGQPRLPLPRAVTPGDHLVGVRLAHFVGRRAHHVTPLANLIDLTARPAALDALANELAPLVLALRHWLAECVVGVEIDKKRWIEPADFIKRGANQLINLEDLVSACSRANRPDLLSFLVDAAKSLASRSSTLWVRSLRTTASLSDRQAARVAAGAFLTALGSLSDLAERFATLHFIDEDYDTAQAVLNDWGEWRSTFHSAARRPASWPSRPPRGGLMSRAYRIELSESLRRRVVVGDSVQAGLELLDVLPREQMAALLSSALEDRGFEVQEDGTLVRVEDDGVEIVVDPQSATVTLRREAARVHEARAERSIDVVQEAAEAAKAKGTKALQERLEQEIKAEAEAHRRELTDQLERRLGDLRAELDQVVNGVVAAALKQRAAQLGEVTEITEDEATGSLTIKVKL